MHNEQKLYQLFDSLGINYTLYEHGAAFTVEQSERVAGFIPGTHCKNLFLKDDKKRLWLIVADNKAVISLKDIAHDYDAKGLRFAQADLLKQYLGVEPGSVCVAGLMNDTDNVVHVLLDASLLKAPLVCFHPLRNTASITVTPQDMIKFIEHCGNMYHMVTL